MESLPAPPAGLHQTGEEFWRATVAAYEIDARDRPVLREVCRTLDEIEQLKQAVEADGVMSTGGAGQPVEHPAMRGLRAHRVTLDRLLSRLALPDEEGQQPLSAVSAHAKTAADARWRNQRQNRAGTAG